MFPNEDKKNILYIDNLIKKYSNFCSNRNDEKEKIKGELSIDIKNKTSKNFISMLEEIIPKSNANKKIEDENMNKIASKIKYFIDEALKSDSDYFSSKNSGDNKNNKEKEVLKKYLDFIKFLLLFEKIMKNKIKFEANFSIRGLIKRLLKSCDSNILIIHDRESYQNRSKKCKIIK